MKKTITKLLISLFSFIIITVSIGIYANAATGAKGYAVYCDGVPVGYWDYWHAAIMYQPTHSYSKPVVQASGFGHVVKLDSWSNFINGNNFKGVYKPKTYISSYYRDRVAAKACELENYDIGYNLAYQVWYDTNQVGSKVDPWEIGSMRCDGVVEYAYEYYGYRIYGSNANWNIASNNLYAREEHSGNAVSPRTQAVDYMTRVQTSVP